MKKNTNQIAVDRDELMAALNAASQCLSTKQVSPILGNFLMTFKDGTLDISATDLDGAVRAAIPIAYTGEATVCVHGQTLLKLVGTLKNETVVFGLIGDDLVIVRDSGDVKLRTADTKMYPVLTFGEPASYRFKFDRADLLEALKLSGFALEANPATHVDAFRGSASLTITTNLIESKFEILSTNTAILSVVNGLCEKNADTEDGQLVLPQKALTQIATILSKSSASDVFISDDANHLFINIGEISYSFRKITVQFPDLSRAITAEFPISFGVNSGEITQTLRRMDIFCDSKRRRVDLAIEDDSITLSSSDADRGDITESFDIRLIGGEPFETGFNIDYLMGIFTRTDDDVTLRFAWAGVGYAMKACKSGDRIKADFLVQGLQKTQVQKAAA